MPPVSTSGLPTVTQPSVYFGLNNTGYVVANTKQPEIDYQLTDGANVETHYTGDGGVQLSSFFNQVDVRRPLQRHQPAHLQPDHQRLAASCSTGASRPGWPKAAPFLSLDADPYPVLLNGHIDWVQDAYTTTANYPYAQNADTSAVTPGSGLLAGSFNYVRNSVKVVIDAYTGKMTFYVMDPNDPIIQTYEKAFPEMFTPASKMSSRAAAHLRYPEDIFTVQATMYGKYHITKASSFYSAADAWTLSPSPGRRLAVRRPRHHPDGQRAGSGRSRPASWCGWRRSTRRLRIPGRASSPSTCSTRSSRCRRGARSRPSPGS